MKWDFKWMRLWFILTENLMLNLTIYFNIGTYCQSQTISIPKCYVYYFYTWHSTDLKSNLLQRYF